MRSLIIGVLLFLVLLVGAMYFAGMLRVDSTPDEVNISVDRQELEQETEEAVRAAKKNSRELLRRAGTALERSGETLQQEAAEQERDTEIEIDVDSP